jgi:hypothetical protein
MTSCSGARGRAALISAAAPGLDPTRAAMLAEMLRLVALDMETRA